MMQGTLSRFRPWFQQLRRRPIIGAAVASVMLTAAYWLLLASDRYVSEAHVIIQRTDITHGQSFDFSSLLGGGGGNRSDQLLLRDHLLSVDMLKQLDARLHLREHYSDAQRDPISRMWFRNASMEWFYAHYLGRVSVEFDDYTGVLVIKAQAYDPKMAHELTSALVHNGEAFMNALAHGLARNQVDFLEKQVAQMGERALQARRAVLDFQNRKSMVSPQATAEIISAIIGRLQAQRSELQTQRAALQAYLVPNHPSIVQLEQQIAAIDRQMALEQAKLTAPGGKKLNSTVEEYQRLEMEAGFAQDVYKTALTALERGRVEALRTIKQVSVIQAPTLPEYPIEPRRIYNTVVFALIAMMLAGVVHLLAAIVRDHKD